MLAHVLIAAETGIARGDVVAEVDGQRAAAEARRPQIWCSCAYSSGSQLPWKP